MRGGSKANCCASTAQLAEVHGTGTSSRRDCYAAGAASKRRYVLYFSLKAKLCIAVRSSLKQGCADEATSQHAPRSSTSAAEPRGLPREHAGTGSPRLPQRRFQAGQQKSEKDESPPLPCPSAALRSKGQSRTGVAGGATAQFVTVPPTPHVAGTAALRL